MILNFGISDIKNASKLHKHAYDKWHSMIERCYSSYVIKIRPSYINTYICDEWRFFSNFLDFYNKNYRDGFHLDKDILGDGTLYSPNTCCWVPVYINTLMNACNTRRGKYKQGVSYHIRYNRYDAIIHEYNKQIFIGCYATEDDAYNAYKHEKLRYVNEVISSALYKNDITYTIAESLYKKFDVFR